MKNTFYDAIMQLREEIKNDEITKEKISLALKTDNNTEAEKILQDIPKDRLPMNFAMSIYTSTRRKKPVENALKTSEEGLPIGKLSVYEHMVLIYTVDKLGMKFRNEGINEEKPLFVSIEGILDNVGIRKGSQQKRYIAEAMENLHTLSFRAWYEKERQFWSLTLFSSVRWPENLEDQDNIHARISPEAIMIFAQKAFLPLDFSIHKIPKHLRIYTIGIFHAVYGYSKLLEGKKWITSIDALLEKHTAYFFDQEKLLQKIESADTPQERKKIQNQKRQNKYKHKKNLVQAMEWVQKNTKYRFIKKDEKIIIDTS